jgi:hypothetical protein
MRSFSGNPGRRLMPARVLVFRGRDSRLKAWVAALLTAAALMAPAALPATASALHPVCRIFENSYMNAVERGDSAGADFWWHQFAVCFNAE